MYTKEEFKERFKSLSDDELIEKGIGMLTDEAAEAVVELLRERGIQGHMLELKISEVKQSLVQRSGVTNHCDYCGKSVFFQPLRSGPQKFCSGRCREESLLAARSATLAPDLIYEHAVAMKFGECPRCGRRDGVVEVRSSYHVVSAIWFYRYSETDHLVCRKCGGKANFWAAVGCVTAGWWSIPGLFSTPYVILKNIRAAYRGDTNADPSAKLLYKAQLELARILTPLVLDEAE